MDGIGLDPVKKPSNLYGNGKLVEFLYCIMQNFMALHGWYWFGPRTYILTGPASRNFRETLLTVVKPARRHLTLPKSDVARGDRANKTAVAAV